MVTDKEIDQIYREYKLALFRYAYKFVKDYHLAYDILGDTVYKLLRRRDKINDVDHLRILLFLSVKNKCLDHLNKCKYLVFDDLTLEEIVSYEEDISAVITKYEVMKELYNGINKLPCKQNMLLNLHIRQDMSIHKAAILMGVSYESARVLKYKAINSLKKIIPLSSITC